MDKSALLILDMQVGMFTLLNPPMYRGEALIATVAELIGAAHRADIPVFYVQHNTGTEVDGTEIWEIHPSLAPLPQDTIIQKYSLDAFSDTPLDQELAQRGITHIVVAGLQTEYCVTNTCLSGAKSGYRVTLIQDGHSTNDKPEQSATAVIADQEALLRQHVSIMCAADVKRQWQPQSSTL